ncbi:MAG: hypothetical protein ABIU07_06645 [Ramlibacter sp.]
MAADLEPIYAELRAVMLRAAPDLTVSRDEPGRLELVASWTHPRKPREPMWFGAVRLGKAYVSVHLMPVYMNAKLQAQIPSSLRARMQGKACFNFKTANTAALAELETLALTCAKAFETPLVF